MRNGINLLSFYIFVFSKFNLYYTIKSKRVLSITFLQSANIIKSTNLFLRYHSTFTSSILLELGSIDILNKLVLFYIYYLPSFNVRFSTTASINYKSSIYSISNIFLNSDWSERENSEMCGVIYNSKHDNRHLLLDYSFLGNPLLKSFPVFGYFELIYDGNLNQLKYQKINFTNSEPLLLNFESL